MGWSQVHTAQQVKIVLDVIYPLGVYRTGAIQYKNHMSEVIRSKTEEALMKQGQKKKVECCKHKHTPRSEALQKDVQTRLNRAIGQLNAVKSMIDDNRYCGDVLTQLAAAEKAVRRVSEIILREHLETCVVEEIRQGNDEVIPEVMGLIKSFS